MMKIGDVIDVVETPRDRDAGNPTWHLAQTETGRERLACERLSDAGYEVYCPQMRVMKTVPRKLLSKRQRINGATVKRPQLSALFPGYIMIRFDKDIGAWHEIFDFAHVRGLVVSDRWTKDRSSPDDVVAGLRAVEVDGAVPGDTSVAVLPYRVGEKVRITSGPFADFPAIVEKLPTAKLEELDESLRIQLVVNIFGGETPVDVEIGQVEHI
ncbi:MAG: transcription termination/antitermination protein NusG [Xanthobacteraceae bacterium]